MNASAASSASSTSSSESGGSLDGSSPGRPLLGELGGVVVLAHFIGSRSLLERPDPVPVAAEHGFLPDLVALRPVVSRVPVGGDVEGVLQFLLELALESQIF